MEQAIADGATTATDWPKLSLRVHLLGGFRVELAGRDVAGSAWRLRKARTIVKLLALAPGRRLGQEEISDLLWPELDPEAALNNFHRTLHAARAALGGGTALLRLEQGVLSLPAGDDVWIDVEAFEVTATVARLSGSIAACHDALALTTGELLPEDRYEDWTSNRRESLRASELSLRVHLAGLHEADGDSVAAESVFRQALAIDPLLEDAVRGLMRALARSGRTHQALREYQSFADALATELDAEPDEPTRHLRTEIETTAFRDNIVPRLSQFALAPLPEETTTLIGREREIAELGELLTQTRLLTLTGPGGVGKTRLALRVAANAASTYRDGVAYIRLDQAIRASHVTAAIAAVFGVREDTGLPLRDALHDRLERAELLLVLDNFEHVLDAAPLVASLLRACSRLTVLTTSREPLRLSAEREYEVRPLNAVDAADAAVALFVERARAVRPGFELASTDAEAVAELCRRIDGLPLAIELAAARIRLLTPQAMLDRLSDRLDLLTGGARDLPVRQQTLRAAIDWSYDLLDPAEQALLRRLSVVSGGCTLETAEALHVALGGDGEQGLDLAASLVERSLLRQEEDAGQPRLTMLETIRAYGLEQLRTDAEEPAARRAHAIWFTRLAEAAAADASGPAQLARLRQIDAEHANLRAALDWSVANDPPLALRLAGVLWRYWYARGFLSEGRQRLGVVLALDGGEPADRARTLHGAGVLTQAQGDYEQATRLLEDGLALARSSGERLTVALSLNHLGVVARDRGEYATAIRQIEESLALFQELGDDWGVALSLNNLGVVAQRQRNHPRAAELLEDSLRRFRTTGDRWGAAIPLNNLGQVALERGDLDLATSALSETLTLYRELGDTRHIAITLTKLALVAEARDDATEAGRLCRESLLLRRDLGDKDGTITAIERLAGVAALAGNARQAVRLLGASSAHRKAIGAPLSPDEGHYIDRVRERASAMLDPLDHEHAWSAGRLMSLEQAVEAALEG